MDRNRTPGVIHAVFAERDGFLEAQLLELALAVSAFDCDGLVRELEHAIVSEYRIARQHGFTPFVRLTNRASRCHRQHFQDAVFEDIGQLKLPPEVGEALAAVLRSPKRVLRLSRVNKVA